MGAQAQLKTSTGQNIPPHHDSRFVVREKRSGNAVRFGVSVRVTLAIGGASVRSSEVVWDTERAVRCGRAGL